MALTLSRWLVLAGLACGVAAVALLPPAPRDGSRRFSLPAPSRLQRLSGQLARARENLKIVRLNEEVRERIIREPLSPGGAPTVLDLGPAMEKQRADYSEALQKFWPQIDLNDSVAVGIVLEGDSANHIWQSHYLFPAASDERSCVVLVPTYSWTAVNRMEERDIQRRFTNELGPCLFFGMYGRPGPDIERWISGRGMDFATYFNPSVRSIPTDDTFEQSQDPIVFVLFEVDWTYYGSMPRGIACLNGQIDTCAEAVDPESTAPISTPNGFRAPSSPWRAPFGALTGSYLADLHRAIGSEAFGRFWRSILPFDQALEEATGTELGEWTHRWAVGRRKIFRPGPLPEKRSVIRVAGLSLLLLGIAIIFSTRRSVF